jgi:hypothetical protein
VVEIEIGWRLMALVMFIAFCAYATLRDDDGPDR